MRKTGEDSTVTDVQMGLWDWHKLNSQTNKGSGDEFPEWKQTKEAFF